MHSALQSRNAKYVEQGALLLIKTDSNRWPVAGHVLNLTPKSLESLEYGKSELRAQCSGHFIKGCKVGNLFCICRASNVLRPVGQMDFEGLPMAVDGMKRGFFGRVCLWLQLRH